MLESTTLASILDFFSKHGDVKVVACEIIHASGLFDPNIILRTLLNSCRHLHRLEFGMYSWDSYLIIDDDFTRALLLHSNLKTFILNCRNVILSEDVLKRENFVANKTMRRLYLENFTGTNSFDDIVKFVLKIFSNLWHLLLNCRGGTMNGVLQTIWKYQVRF